MKLIAQITVGIILGWLGIQAITLLEARLVAREQEAAVPRRSAMPAQPALPRFPAALRPRANATATGPSQPAAKPCEITKANGTTLHCEGPLTDPQ
ncbi:MAG TPA: hypothetical protein VIY90_03295 [Steroidobacteraceae bacterium]